MSTALPPFRFLLIILNLGIRVGGNKKGFVGGIVGYNKGKISKSENTGKLYFYFDPSFGSGGSKYYLGGVSGLNLKSYFVELWYYPDFTQDSRRILSTSSRRKTCST